MNRATSEIAVRQSMRVSRAYKTEPTALEYGMRAIFSRSSWFAGPIALVSWTVGGRRGNRGGCWSGGR